MRLPSFKRLFSTDFPQDYRALVDLMSVSINSGFESLYEALNKKLTLKDNLACTEKTVDITVDASGFPKTKTVVTLDTTGLRVESVVVSRVLTSTNSAVYLTSAPFVSFTQENNTIIINHVTGLSSEISYKMRIIAFAN